MNTLEERTLIDGLLEEQRLLTAVSKFTQRHEDRELPEQARYYRDLLPLSMPGEGQQYAFEVDLDRCSGCKACVTACHNLNGLAENETWRSVGVIHGRNSGHAVQRFVTASCHHCVDPACLNGCPVNAYEKDALTGIVRHLDDQCIGCQYCILKCPYDVPQYHQQKGIVRKCDMCSSRLAVGEAPACVQACPNEAIRITLVDKVQIALGFTPTQTGNSFLPAAPEPNYTLPTTQYRTRCHLPEDMQAGDLHKVKPEPSHPPLILMLVLTQLSVGAFFVDFLMRLFLPSSAGKQFGAMPATAALAFGLTGLGASIFHLGRPLLAWRAVLGLKRSWLSREIVVFGAFAALALAYVSSLWLRTFQEFPFVQSLGACVALTGLLGVFCSHMIYHDTQRVFWLGCKTAVKFFGTTLLLGVCLASCTLTFEAWRGSVMAEPAPQKLFVLAGLLITTSIAKLGYEFGFLKPLRDDGFSPATQTALLITGELRGVWSARLLCGFLGGAFVPILSLCSVAIDHRSSGMTALLALAALLLCLAGELLERYLFFTAVVAPKMPGSAAA